MDLAWANSIFTVCIAISFAVILLIVLNKRNKSNYQEAARSILEDNDVPEEAPSAQTNRENGE